MEGGNDKSYFYKLQPRDEQILEAYWPKMKCINEPNDLAIWGTYDSSHAQNLQIAFEICDEETSAVKCKSEDEIK